MRLKALIIGMAMAGMALSSAALNVGRARGAAWIGQPLDLVVAVQLDGNPGDSNICPEAEVYHGDSRLESGRVRVATEPSREADTVNLRVISSTLIDEPVVTVYVRAGCGPQKVARRFVLLADFPPETSASRNVTPAAPVVPTVTLPESAQSGASTLAVPAATAPTSQPLPGSSTAASTAASASVGGTIAIATAPAAPVAAATAPAAPAPSAAPVPAATAPEKTVAPPPKPQPEKAAEAKPVAMKPAPVAPAAPKAPANAAVPKPAPVVAPAVTAPPPAPVVIAKEAASSAKSASADAKAAPKPAPKETESAPAKEAAKATPNTAAKATAAPPSNAGKPRLKLDPVESGVGAKPDATSETAPPVNSDKDGKHVEELQASVKALLDQSAKNEAALLALKERLEKAESERVSMEVVYALLALLVLALGGLLYVWKRRSQAPWQDEDDAPDPVRSVPAVSSALEPDSSDIDVVHIDDSAMDSPASKNTRR